MAIITEIKQVVNGLLIKHPRLRDNDLSLIANVWHNQMKADGSNAHQMTADVFLLKFSMGKYASPESIRRCRQKLQEENEDLRGEKYNKRHKAQETVKNELGYK